MAYRLTADSCPDGPCPLMAVDDERRMALVQGYVAGPTPELGAIPDGEARIEMEWDVLERMVDEHRAATQS